MAHQKDYTGQIIGNRLILSRRCSEPGKDGKHRSLYAWRCLACGSESESVFSVLAKADRDGRRVCSNCTTTRDAAPIPAGTVVNRLEVVGPCQRGNRNGKNGWKRIVPVRCTSCQREYLVHKSSLQAGTANCRCELNTLDGRSKTLEGDLFMKARGRAKDQGVPFDITVEDIVIPDLCPVLSIPLVRGKGGWAEGSPTLDKIIPSLGYVPGNIAVMSWRANRLKQDGTLEELRAIVEWMDKQKGARLAA